MKTCAKLSKILMKLRKIFSETQKYECLHFSVHPKSAKNTESAKSFLNRTLFLNPTSKISLNTRKNGNKLILHNMYRAF